MATRTTGLDLKLTGDSNILNKLKEIKQLGIDLQKKAVKIAVDGHDELDKAAKSAYEMGKKAEEAGKKADKAMKQAADGAKEAEKGFESIQDVLQDGIPGALQAIDKQLVGTLSKVTGMSKNTASIVAGVGVAVGTAVGAGLSIAVTKAADLEDVMIGVKKKTGLGDEVGEDIQSLMKLTGKDMYQIGGAYESAGAMGIGGDLVAKGDMEGARAQLSEYVKINLMASQAFDMGAEETADALGNLSNVYRSKTESINGFLMSMASTVDYVADNTVAKESQIISALTRAGPAIAQYQKSAKLSTDTTALAGALISTGQTGEYSGQIINSLYNDLITNKEGKISAKLQMNPMVYAKAVAEDPSAILDKLLEKYSKLSPGQGRSNFLKSLGFSQDDLSAQVFKYSQDEKFKNALEAGRKGSGGAYEAADRLQTAFDKSMEGTYVQWDRFKQILIVIAQVIGGIFLPGINAILKALNYVLDPMTTLIAGFIEFAAAIPGAKLIALVVSLAAVAAAVAAIVTVILPAIAGIGMVGTVVSAVSVALSVFGGILAIIAGALTWPVVLALALGAALVYVAQKTGFLSKAFEKFKGSEIGKDLLGVWEGIKAKFGELVAWLCEKWDSFMGWLSGGGKAGEGALAGLFGWLGGMFDKLDGFYKKLKTPEGMAGLKKGLSVVAMAASPILIPPKILGLVVEWLTKIFTSTDPLADLLEYALDIWNKAKGILQSLWDAVVGFGQWIKDMLGITKAEKEDQFNKISDSSGYYHFKEWDKDLGAFREGWRKKGKGDVAEVDVPKHVLDAYAAWQNAPKSLAEQIGDAVKGVLPSWAGGKEKPAEIPNDTPPAEEDEGPGIGERILNWISDFVLGDPEKKKARDDFINGLLAQGVSQRDAEAYATKSGYTYASGARFGSKGWFSGIVDPTEEIIPQAITERGPGPLSQLLGQIYGVSGDSSGGLGGGLTSIQNHFHVGSIRSENDLERLAELVVSKSQAANRHSVERYGGYYRGGTVYR